MSRTVPEWIGKTPDTRVPETVQKRILRKYNNTCALSKRKLVAGDEIEFHHLIPLCLDGENRESNLVPVLSKFHKVETKRQIREKAKADRAGKKHFGITRPKQSIKSQGFAKSQKKAKIDKAAIDDVAVIRGKGIYNG